MMKPRSVYIAAPFNQRQYAKQCREALADIGIESTARWIDSHLTESGLNYDEKQKEAREDLLDIHRADAMVFLNGPSTTGGMHVEFGFALAKGKNILFVGEPSSIFHCHSSVVKVYPTVERLVYGLDDR